MRGQCGGRTVTTACTATGAARQETAAGRQRPRTASRQTADGGPYKPTAHQANKPQSNGYQCKTNKTTKFTLQALDPKNHL